MTALILGLVLLVVAVPLAWLLRRRLQRERAAYKAAQVAAAVERMALTLQETARVIGESFTPAVQRATAAFASFADAFRTAADRDLGEGRSSVNPTDTPKEIDMTSLIPDPEDESVWLIAHASAWPSGQQVGATAIHNVHSPDKCLGEHCLVHNPSDHHMRSWILNWRGDKGVMERICPHGVGHPDPDSASFLRKIGREVLLTHGCDGCCKEPHEP